MSTIEQAFLDALDGVAYVTDSDGVVLMVGQPQWDVFADGARARDDQTPASPVLGRSVFEAMTGEEVRTAYRTIYRRLLDDQHRSVGFEYRCDAPDLGRRMRMSITRIQHRGAPLRLLHQSQLLSAVSRPWMTLFEPHRIVEFAQAEAGLPIVTMCGFCQQLAWPPSESGWVPPELYYRLGGPADVRVSHGVCPECVPKL